MRSRGAWPLLIATLLVLQCPSSTSAAERIRIGFFAPLSGFAAEDGQSARNGAMIALEELRKDPALADANLELVVYDDQGDLKQATSIVRKLITSDQVVGVVSGSYSGPTNVAAPIAQELGVPMISAYAVHPGITQAGDRIFRMIYTGPVKGKALTLYATDRLKKKRVALLYWEKEYGASIAEGIQEAIKAMGGELVFSRSFSAGEKDFSPHITAMKETNPQALLVVSIYGPGAKILRRAKELGVEIPLVAPDGLDASKFPALAGDAAEGVYVVTNFSRDEPRPIVQTFIKRYEEKHGLVPDMVAASSFDAVILMGEAIKKAGKSRDGVSNALRDNKDVEGVTGKLTFTPEREVRMDIVVNQIRGGRYRFVDRIPAAELAR